MGVVTYRDAKFVIVQPHDKYTPYLKNDAIVEIEVIGNIHQHSRLLEQMS